MNSEDCINLKDYIASYPGFPKEGIIFRDIMPLLQCPEARSKAVIDMSDNIYNACHDVQLIIAPEARGFIFGSLIADELDLPFVPARKAGKLPGEIIEQEYDLEYGKATLQVPAKAIVPGCKVAIVDDLLATGGTIKAIAQMVEEMGGEVVHVATLIDLVDLKGRDALNGYSVSSLITFEGE